MSTTNDDYLPVRPEVDDFLEHFGVKGMKWGQRRAEAKAAKADAKWTSKVTSSFPFQVHNTAANAMNNGRIDELNNRPEFKGKNFSDVNSPQTKKYYDTYSKMFTEELNKAVATTPGAISPSGKKRLKLSYDVVDSGLQWKVEDID